MRKQDQLRTLDVKILDVMALYGPRNKSRLAAELGIPLGTLRYRLKYLRSHFSLYLQGNLYHTNIGLRKSVVLAESKPGYEDFLYQCLKTNEYWLYVSACAGAPKCFAIYGIPTENSEQFEEFMTQLRELEPVNSVKFYWSTCFQNVNTTNTWFDEASEQWIFPWDSWLKETQNDHGELPYTLIDPPEYTQKADMIDIIILKELEKNCEVRLKDIAGKLDTSIQRVKYHLENHVLKEKMFEGHQILVDHYRDLHPDTYYFRFDFSSHQNLARFAGSTLNKPFVRALGKVYHKNQLFVQIYLPRNQARNFIEGLSKLVKTGYLNTYEYVTQDLSKTVRQTISYEYFKDRKWTYDHSKYLENLQSTARRLMRS